MAVIVIEVDVDNFAFGGRVVSHIDLGLAVGLAFDFADNAYMSVATAVFAEENDITRAVEVGVEVFRICIKGMEAFFGKDAF